jgi:hypothetical protein
VQNYTDRCTDTHAFCALCYMSPAFRHSSMEVARNV